MEVIASAIAIILSCAVFFAESSDARADVGTSPSLIAPTGPNYHLVGWSNALIPGSGQMMLGHYALGAGEAVFELGTFLWGFSLSKLSPMSLDGVPEDLPTFSRTSRFSQANIDKGLSADILQEIGIKTHFVNTFMAYREAAESDPEASKKIDQRPLWDMFMDPFKLSNFEDPWVWAATGGLVVETTVTYFLTRNTLPRGAQLTPYSNTLYSFNYGILQPIGSGVPEELFYRGFIQNEMFSLVDSPFFAIAMSTAAFAFSHEAGTGRLTASVAGGYLGYLAFRNHGNLAQGITLHYWGDLLLGVQTILLNHDAQRTTPPTGMLVQVNF